MSIIYDNKRKDITFCTMLFKIPQQSDLSSLKKMDRKFEEFYLPSLKRLLCGVIDKRQNILKKKN